MVQKAAARRSGGELAGLALVEDLTAKYAAARKELAAVVIAADRDQSAALRSHMPQLKRAIAEANAAHSRLHDAIAENKGEFEKPRTRLFHNIRVGLKKMIGKITWEDDDRVVALIERHFPESAEILIKTVKTPVKEAIEKLSVVDVKRIGCLVGEDTDAVVITPADTDVDKLVKALTKEPKKAET